MSKVIRLSDIMEERLEEYRKSQIERARLLIPSCSACKNDIKRYEEMTIPELVEDAIRSSLVWSEMSVEDLSKIERS